MPARMDCPLCFKTMGVGEDVEKLQLFVGLWNGSENNRKSLQKIKLLTHDSAIPPPLET